MGEEVSWIFQNKVKPGQVDDLKALVKEMVEATREEEGAVIYEYFLSDDETTMHLYERYRDSDAAMVHMGNFGRNFAKRFMDTAEPTGIAVYGNPGEDLRGALAPLSPAYLGPLDGFAR